MWKRLSGGQEDSEYARALNMSLLGIFYFEEGTGEDDFYGMFEEKVRRFRGLTGSYLQAGFYREILAGEI